MSATSKLDRLTESAIKAKTLGENPKGCFFETLSSVSQQAESQSL